MSQLFELNIPILKSTKDKSGQTIVHGVACDASVDMQNEITDPEGLKLSLPYLRKFGKFNDDHSKTFVGEVIAADVVTKGELVKKGILNDIDPSEINEKVLYVKGPLYGKVARAQYYKDVLDSGGRLGFSIQGSVLEKTTAVAKSSEGRQVNVNKRCFINQIAITGQPVNQNTWAAIAKSHGANNTELFDAISKAFTAGSDVVVPGDTGGCTVREQSLQGKKNPKRRVKRMSIKKSIAVDSIDTPAKIIKAWTKEIPAMIEAGEPVDVVEIAKSISEAAKTRGLNWALERDTGSENDFTKSLSENDLVTLDYLETADVEEIQNILEKSAARKKVPEPMEDEEDEEYSDEEDEESEGEPETEEESEETDEEEEEEHKPKAKKKGGPVPEFAKKSLSEQLQDDEDTSEALEITPFLKSFTDKVSESLEEQSEAIGYLSDNIVNAIAKGIEAGMGAIIAPLTEQITKSLADIHGELDSMGRRPVRRGEYIIKKGMGESDEETIPQGRANDILQKAFAAGLTELKNITQNEMYPGSVDSSIIKSLETQLKDKGIAV